MKTLICIVGPTAVGKTAFSIRLAKRFDTVILSADSRQFFKEMNIGTSKPTGLELQAAPHFFIGNISVHENYNAGRFEADALQKLSEIFSENNAAILCGGSGLYINAVCHGFDSLPEADDNLRTQLKNLAEEKGVVALQDLLREKDPDYYATVDLNNPQRLVRALEVCLATGKSYSSFRNKQKVQRPFRIIKIGLNLPRELLYEKINQRVDAMMQQGLLEEAKTLYPHRHLNALQTVGYEELFQHFEGKFSLEQAVSLIKQNTRRYSKRQLTWFRKDKEIQWFQPDEWERAGEWLEVLM